MRILQWYSLQIGAGLLAHLWTQMQALAQPISAPQPSLALTALPTPYQATAPALRGLAASSPTLDENVAFSPLSSMGPKAPGPYFAQESSLAPSPSSGELAVYYEPCQTDYTPPRLPNPDLCTDSYSVGVDGYVGRGTSGQAHICKCL